MRIKTFCKNIDIIALKGHKLNDSTLVIDGQNMLYKFYGEKGLQFVFGSESNVYADYLKEYLSMFKKANVKCYFIFKGGHEKIEKKFKTVTATDKVMGYNFDFDGDHTNIVQPIFMKDIYAQVLDEMGFDYVISEYESKEEIMALAQKLNCPVCSFDIEYCFSGVPYVLYTSIVYNQEENKMTCSIVDLDRLLRSFRLTDSLLAIFIVLTDIQIFPENHFMEFIKSLRIPIGNFKRNIGILQWLSKTTRERALAQIFKYTSTETKTKFLEAEIYAKSIIRRRVTPGLPSEYLLNGEVEITERDPQWFEKGVISKHIALPYVNLYRSNVLIGSWAIADKEADDAILPAVKIIKYAYNLLTNFKKEEFTLFSKDLTEEESIPISVTDCVQKPNFDAIDSPFENGWDQNMKSLGLMEHFIKEALPGFDFERLEKVPGNAKLLIIALVYYHHQRSDDASNEACCLLLSYVALSLLNDDDSKLTMKSSNSSPDNSVTDANTISSHDKRVAMNTLATFFKEVTMEEAKTIFDSKLIQPLVEFQHCLQQLNYLNRLCGRPYVPTVYSKTFNGTFVYKILHTIKNDNDGNCFEFLNKLLNPAATVLTFLNGLINLYEDLI